jgi:hypothetical protein
MKPVLVIREERIELPPDQFYGAMKFAIDRAQPPAHMSCDYLDDPLGMGLLIFRLEIYRQMEAANGRASS